MRAVMQPQAMGQCAPLKGGRTSGLLVATAIAAATCAAPAVAQDTAPPTRGEITVPQSLPDERRGLTLTIDGEMERAPCALDDPEYDALTFTLTEVSYVGAERAVGVPLDDAHASYLGRTLPIRALCDIRDRAAAILEDAGYLAAVEIPPQSLGDGRAEMRVVLGRLVAVRARGDTEGAESLIEGYLQRLVGQDVFNVREAERYLLLANDVPGMDVRLSLRPAADGAPGDLVGEIAVLRQWGAIDANVQNWGSKALGRWGGLLRAEVYNATGSGDVTSIAAFSTLDFDEQQTLQFAHQMQLGSDGLTLGGQVTLGWTEPDALPGFVIESDTFFASIEASYPFLRTQRDSVWGALGFDVVDQDVSINDTPFTRDRVRTAYVRGTYVHVDADSVARRGGYSPYEPRYRLAASLEARQGLDVFGTNEDCRGRVVDCLANGGIGAARIEQDPTPFILRGGVSTEYRPIPLLAIAFDLDAQYADSPVPAFEEYAGGNYAIGRGYDPSSILGDSGIGAALELRWGSMVPARTTALAVQPYLFTDFAWAQQEDPSILDQKQDLWSAGGGVRFVRGGNIQGDVLLAVPLKRLDSTGERPGVRLMVSLTARLAPWR